MDGPWGPWPGDMTWGRRAGWGWGWCRLGCLPQPRERPCHCLSFIYGELPSLCARPRALCPTRTIALQAQGQQRSRTPDGGCRASFFGENTASVLRGSVRCPALLEMWTGWRSPRCSWCPGFAPFGAGAQTPVDLGDVGRLCVARVGALHLLPKLLLCLEALSWVRDPPKQAHVLGWGGLSRQESGAMPWHGADIPFLVAFAGHREDHEHSAE